MIHVGVTGTEHGMMPSQRETFIDCIEGLLGVDQITLHHGDCIGVDAQAHAIAIERGCEIVIHPPDNPKKRANCAGHAGHTGQVNIRPMKPYLERNHDIVDESQLMYVMPETSYSVLRSGTWATQRYAERIQRPWLIIRPDGETIREMVSEPRPR